MQHDRCKREKSRKKRPQRSASPTNRPRYRLCHRRFSPLHCHPERSEGSALKIAARVAPASQPAVAWASLPTLTPRQHFHGRGRRTAPCLTAVAFRNPKVVILPNRRPSNRIIGPVAAGAAWLPRHSSPVFHSAARPTAVDIFPAPNLTRRHRKGRHETAKQTDSSELATMRPCRR